VAPKIDLLAAKAISCGRLLARSASPVRRKYTSRYDCFSNSAVPTAEKARLAADSSGAVPLCRSRRLRRATFAAFYFVDHHPHAFRPPNEESMSRSFSRAYEAAETEANFGDLPRCSTKAYRSAEYSRNLAVTPSQPVGGKAKRSCPKRGVNGRGLILSLGTGE
jgi:hypothetical protein